MGEEVSQVGGLAREAPLHVPGWGPFMGCVQRQAVMGGLPQKAEGAAQMREDHGGRRQVGET